MRPVVVTPDSETRHVPVFEIIRNIIRRDRHPPAIRFLDTQSEIRCPAQGVLGLLAAANLTVVLRTPAPGVDVDADPDSTDDRVLEIISRLFKDVRERVVYRVKTTPATAGEF